MNSYRQMTMAIAGLMAGLIGGCSGGKNCEPHMGKACQEGVLYWTDSCGQPEEVIEECECGCDPDKAACKEDCMCEPSCQGKECGSDGCGDNDNCGKCEEGWTCKNGTCVLPGTCNNGQLETYEECEGFDLRGRTCESLGYDGGDLACSDDCILDTSQCRKCGNGAREVTEECDGGDLGGSTCESLGYDAGELACTGWCIYDVSDCFKYVRCPDDMVAIEGRFCIDIYEASRPDATADSYGTDNSVATSRYGVLPRIVDNNAEAQTACEAAGKTLCTESQWFQACRGPEKLVYGYGDDYDPEICNGIDKFCSCTGDSPCAGHDPCPYPHCHDDCPEYRHTPFHLEPTPTDPLCTNEYGIFDMSGNVWEHVLGGDGTRVRGGSFNTSDSESLLRCDYIPTTWEPSMSGFRCCSAGLPSGGG